MENAKKLYNEWLSYELEDLDLKKELEEIKGDEDAVFDRFYRELSFGTAGLRGVIGAGTNRMNVYTVRKATLGLAKMLLEKKANPSVAISYDSRIKSETFAREAAVTLASKGIRVYITNRLMPTPVLSFCVREYNCDAGIMITASHNPSEYNGYKAYGPDGCQMNAEDSARVLALAENIPTLSEKHTLNFEEAMAQGLISYVKEDVYEDYYSRVVNLSLSKNSIKDAGLKIVYTPLNGTGNEPVRKVLRRLGVDNICVVKEQEFPNGNFTTCPYPNPEIRETLALGIELMQKKEADLLLATDPDADRVGIAVKSSNGDAVLMTGNQVGVLLIDYICKVKNENGSMPKNPIAVKSIVSTALADKVCEEYGVEMINVLTGFKYIGEQIRLLEEKGEQDRFILGFEESYGYLSGSFVRDKDAVIASMLIVEMASFYKAQGKTLLDVYTEIEKRHGVYFGKVENFFFEGASGMDKMGEIMASLRKNPPLEIAGFKTLFISDFESRTKTCLATGEKTSINLPKADVLIFDLENNCKMIVRPSGTEPKIKIYHTVVAKTAAEAEEICKGFSEKANEIVK